MNILEIINGRFGNKVLRRPYRGIWKTFVLVLIFFAALYPFIRIMSWITDFCNYVFY
nr:MAG TPA: hypothetical protein [Bacteriophage sp.]